MSAECSKCGTDIAYPEGTWPLGECPRCSLIENRWAAFTDDELEALTEATDYLQLGDVDRLNYLHSILDLIMTQIESERARRAAAKRSP